MHIISSNHQVRRMFRSGLLSLYPPFPCSLFSPKKRNQSIHVWCLAKSAGFVSKSLKFVQFPKREYHRKETFLLCICTIMSVLMRRFNCGLSVLFPRQAYKFASVRSTRDSTFYYFIFRLQKHDHNDQLEC